MNKLYPILCLAMLLFTACSKDKVNEIHETIHIHNKGADMPVYVHGNAEDKTFVIMLHGAGSFGLAFREGAFTEKFEEDYVMVYWDQRAQGMSEGRFDYPENVIDLMSEDLEVLVKTLKYRYGDDIKLVLMGHSWGGALGTYYLLRDGQQELFNSWIIIDGVHDFPLSAQTRQSLMLSIAEDQLAAGLNVERWEEIQENLLELDSNNSEDYDAILNMALKVQGQLIEDGMIGDQETGELLRRTIIDNNPINWLVNHANFQPAQWGVKNELSMADHLDQITLPTLFLWGKYDVSVPPRVGRDAFDRYGSAEKKFVLFEETIHHPFNTEKDKFRDEVSSFIELHL
ncbi:alpha/beta hydrolase [bacterium]|nr:alpha/beta hydrolase [bacterium]